MSMLLLAALFAAQPDTTPPSPPIGQRTVSPQALIQEMGLAPDQDDLEASIRAAAAHPLGSRENPVRVGGPTGERAYLARLRCSDGSTPRVGQRANLGAGAFGSIVDGFPLDCGSAAPGRVTVVMDMYHEEHRETGAPTGFTLVAE